MQECTGKGERFTGERKRHVKKGRGGFEGRGKREESEERSSQDEVIKKRRVKTTERSET